MRIKMGSWKNHVRARLQHRDQTEKLPFTGVFTSCKIHFFCFATMMHLHRLTLRTSVKSVCFLLVSQLEERFEIRKQILEDVQSKR